jgi:hypothetical protein
MFAQEELFKALPPYGWLIAKNGLGEVLGYFLGHLFCVPSLSMVAA